MSSYLMLTATGRDRPGVVDKVSEKIAIHHGNVEMSRMARLGGEFAMLALVELPEDRVDSLLGALAELEEGGLVTRVRKTTRGESSFRSGKSALNVRVTGADHPGIIQKVAHELSLLNVNIETMDTKVTNAPLSGAPLFTMNAMVFAPDSVSLSKLEEVMETVSDELAVDIEVGPYSAAGERG